MICMAKVIVWDEAPMNHRYQLEALDRTLKDLTGFDVPFGGKTVVLSGDFRQCLPVIKQANRAQVVDAAHKLSSCHQPVHYLLSFFDVKLRLV